LRSLQLPPSYSNAVQRALLHKA